MRDSVGPANYNVTPDMRRRGQNPKWLGTGPRRFSFNEHVEAVDVLRKTSHSCLEETDWRKIKLIGI